MFVVGSGSVTCGFVVFFFFKQKTAYEMRISDWSSDVCSSDLAVRQRRAAGRDNFVARLGRHDPCLYGARCDGPAGGQVAWLDGIVARKDGHQHTATRPSSRISAKRIAGPMPRTSFR